MLGEYDTDTNVSARHHLGRDAGKNWPSLDRSVCMTHDHIACTGAHGGRAQIFTDKNTNKWTPTASKSWLCKNIVTLQI